MQSFSLSATYFVVFCAAAYLLGWSMRTGDYTWPLQRNAGTRLGKRATLPVPGSAPMSPAWPCLLAETVEVWTVVKPPSTCTCSSQGADMCTARCVGLDIRLRVRRRCTEQNQSTCCVVGHVMSSTSHLVVLDWSGANYVLPFYARLCATYTWKVLLAQGVRIRVQAKHFTPLRVRWRALTHLLLVNRTVLTSFFAS